VKRSEGFIWYDKSATDHRVWCVRRGDSTVRAALVTFADGCSQFIEAGHAELQPGGPRGAILASDIETVDEVPCG
jgi:hypothetical protein